MIKTKPAKKPSTRFRRETPQDRRRQLGEAALRCIVKHGNAGVSVHQISVEADVPSEGLLQAIMAAVDAAPRGAYSQ